MLPCGLLNSRYEQDMAIVRTRVQWVLLASFLILLLVPAIVANVRLLAFLIMCGIYIIAVHGLSIVTGLSGQISLGQAAFMAAGGYTAVILVNHGLPWIVAFLLAPVVSGVLGLIFGIPSFRIKGFYLLMVTVAAHFVIMWIIENGAAAWTGGSDGINVKPFEVLGFTFISERAVYLLVLGFAVLTTILTKNISRSRAGRAFVAIRDNDVAAKVMGIDISKYKLLAFTVSAMYGGLAGVLFAIYLLRLSPEFFLIMIAIWMLGMMIVGGVGSTMGAICGVIFIRGLDQLVWMGAPYLSSFLPFINEQFISASSYIMFGIVIILFLMFEPRGLNHRWEVFKASYRLHPFSY